jgi:hypothetical protein
LIVLISMFILFLFAICFFYVKFHKVVDENLDFQ